MSIPVSVIVPAYNAAATLSATLESLLAQSTPEWEAIVVDDGSTDDTADIARRYVDRDNRVRTLTTTHGGASAARNAGLAAAGHQWLLFLDADDWLTTDALEQLTGAVSETADAVYGAWQRVAADGSAIPEVFRPEPNEMFAVTARFCPFAIHSCLVRRARVISVGGFDTSLRVGEDWDLWQRLARTGARFVSIANVVALYRTRPGSAGSDVESLVRVGLSVIDRGHGRDPRVGNAAPPHADGLPRSELARAQFSYICWPAGLLLGRGDDASRVLDALADARAPDLSPGAVARSIFQAALLPAARHPMEWPRLWDAVEPKLDRFLVELEARAAAEGLAQRVRRELESIVVEHAIDCLPVTVGATAAIRVDTTEPMPTFRAPTGVQRLLCIVRTDDTTLGRLTLPVCDDAVPADVLADAIAARFAWPLLGQFFGQTVYPALEWRNETPDSVETTSAPSLWRGSLCLARGQPAPREDRDAWVHQRVGWTVFLQEVWSLPGWPGERFYDPAANSGDLALPDDTIPAASGLATIEASAAVTDIRSAPGALHVLLTLGGAPVVMARVPVPPDGRVPAQALRAAVTAAAGFELCVAAVREGLLGIPLRDPRPLRDRLADRNATRTARALPTSQRSRLVGESLIAGAERAVEEAAHTGVGLMLGRRPGPASTSVSRRARLPGAAAATLEHAAVMAGDPSLRLAPNGAAAYVPDLFRLPNLNGEPSASDTGASPPVAPHGANAAGFDRHHFESLFVERADPWQYATPYERRKYEHILSLVAGRPRRALELACAEGMFTELLARCVGRLVATDIAQTALDRAAARCADVRNVEFAQLDFMNDAIPGRFDLVVCSEVLYYAADEAALTAIARKLRDALANRGCLLLAHSFVVVDDPTSPGLDWDVPFGAKRIGDIVAGTEGLALEAELRTPLYRVQRFRRRVADDSAAPHIEYAEHLPPHPEVARRCLMQGGAVHRGCVPEWLTYRLPILMYHRVTPDTTPGTTRYAVTPATFEEQLRYLHDARFRSVSLDEWRRAKEAWTPLRGRAILITVDDGYRDFAEHAWPLLRRYGFRASVFVVTDRVGGTSEWDRGSGSVAPLLGWDDIRRLAADGVEFGSHTATRRHLTGLEPAEVVREAARSRAVLHRELGTPITALAYPHGAEDEVIHHLIGASGYLYGVSCRPGPSNLWDPLLALPRIEVTATMTLQDFIAALGR